MAQVYKYTPNDIARMTPYQQVMLYAPDAVSETLHFNTMEEFLEWKAHR